MVAKGGPFKIHKSWVVKVSDMSSKIHRYELHYHGSKWVASSFLGRSKPGNKAIYTHLRTDPSRTLGFLKGSGKVPRLRQNIASESLPYLKSKLDLNVLFLQKKAEIHQRVMAFVRGCCVYGTYP